MPLMSPGNIKLLKLPVVFVLFFCVVCLSTCTYDKEPLGQVKGCYPDNIAKIFSVKCATAGCHNTQSKNGAGGFDLSTWDHLFDGGRNGSSVIPYRADESFLMYFINTYPDIDTTILTPTMPNNGQVLSRNEVITVRDWIQNGAPDCKGNVKFCCDPLRKKFYVCHQRSDLVTVFDSKTRLPMRIINVGDNPTQIESAHDIVVSPDGNYWYVIFLSGQVMQKFRTSDDSFVGQVTLGSGQWTSMAISDDSRHAVVVSISGSPINGKVYLVDLENMTTGSALTDVIKPHGCAVSSDFKTLYVTEQSGNYIHKYDISNPSSPSRDDVVLLSGPGHPISTLPSLDPHQVAISPDGTKYYVTCQGSNDVRVMSVAADTLISIINNVGDQPQEIVFSQTHPYLFVSCMNDSNTYMNNTYGSMAVINYNTDLLDRHIFTGWQPHGFDVDDGAGVVYVANRNVNTSGPAPHHSSGANRNGYVTIIDMNTLSLIPDYKIEVSFDPYELGVRK